MSFFEKINEFNQYISFHIFAFAGWIALFVKIYLYRIYCQELQKYGGPGDWGDGFAWLTIGASALAFFVFVIAFIIFLFERVFYFKIKNRFLLENKILKLFRYVGAFLALIYIIFNLFYLVSFQINSFLKPDELIYFDGHINIAAFSS